MSAKLVLYFTAAEHVLYRWSRGALELEARLPANDEGLAAFRARLQGRRGALVYVLADLAGEDFHEDQIPYLRGGDRQAVVQRRLAQRYRDTRLAAALSLGYASGERRTERLLLASFTNTQQFTPWLDALAESGARLSGVFSVPLLAPVLAARLGLRGGRAFVVSADSAGLRQCYVEEGRLRFSRLERVADMAPEALAAFVRAETLRLAQYLTTLRALPREAPPVQVLVVAPAGQRAVFERALVSDARLSFITVDLPEAARKAGCKRLARDAAGEAPFLYLSVRHPPREQFARLEDRRAYVLWRLQRAIVAAGGAAALACAVAAGLQWFDATSLRGQARLQQREAGADSQQYQRITASFPVTQTSSDNLKATVVQFLRIAARSASPEPAFVYLSQVLDRFPQIELESLQWQIANSARLKPAETAPAQGDAPLKGVLQTLEVTGHVNAIKRSDYRAITAEVQSFAQALHIDPGWRILHTQLPFDITPEGTLTGDIGSAEGTEAPRFTILIGRELK